MALLLSTGNLKEPMGDKWPAQDGLLARSFEVFCRTVFKLYCPLKIHGQDNLPEPPFLLCSNHASHLDSSMLMMASGLPFQSIGLIAAKDYFFDQGSRFFLHYMMNLVPIARGSGARALKDSIVACRSFLNSGGKALIIFPEGTRSVDGKIARFKEGAAILAHELDLPMVPACVVGSSGVLPKGSYFIKPKKLSVYIGKPLLVKDWISFEDELDRKAIFIAYRETIREVENRVRALAKEAGANGAE